MGLFNLFKGNPASSTGKDIINWIPLTTIEQLDQLVEESTHKLAVIFKHSKRCGISRMILRNFQDTYDIEDDKAVNLYFLDILSYRNVSDEVAARFQVWHESPQLVILKNKKIVYHNSHSNIRADDVKGYI
ncbi:bacillithiol system redox-active protein YtxJ [Leptobacterium sp. I13]|uniref:bacillithiol system redox-active protein YtxJ n=1 Tax=Leptobacterium meishanense TaxID=3128904 RepID=UPI0030EF46B7